jgi:transposase
MESGGTLRMSRKERERLVELEAVKRGEQSLGDAAHRLGLSYRQARRVWRRFRAEGEQGLLHRLRGQRSKRGKSADLRRECVEQYRERLEGFGPTLAAEKLAEWGWEVDHETLRRWLAGAGLWLPRAQRRKHRRWRARKSHFGQLVQMDGSHHRWFGGEKSCLVSMVDDATGVRHSLLAEEETTEAAMRLLWLWVERYGVPRGLYTDRKNVYLTKRQPTLEEELAGEPALTAFGRACHKLGLEIIPASSPQAKGRIERSHRVYQDRLVKEIALQQLSTIDEVNALLRGGFDQGLNDRFAQPALDPLDMHRPLAAGLQLREIFAYETYRTVREDWTIRHHNRWLQIAGKQAALPPARARVLVRELLDGTMQVVYRALAVRFLELDRPPAPTPRATPSPRPGLPKPTAPSPTPDDYHPWRATFSHKARRAAARASASNVEQLSRGHF